MVRVNIDEIPADEFGKILSGYAASRGLTIRDLADRLGWQSTSVMRTFQGERKLGFWEWIKFCDVLSIDPVEFLKELERK